MEVNSKTGDIIIRFDDPEEAMGLVAVLSGQTAGMDPKLVELAQWVYAWLYAEVYKYATRWNTEVVGHPRPLSARDYIPPGQGKVITKK